MSFLDRLFNKADDPEQELVAEAIVGDSFSTWVVSDVGRYVIGKAEQDEISRLQALLGVDPEDALKMAMAQADAKVPGLLLSWIEAAINQGEVAKFQLNEMEE